MKLIFMGTPDFSVPALEALVKGGHEILAVYTQPPRPAGRGQKEKKSPIHLAAEKLNISVKTPKSLKNSVEQEEFVSLGADLAVVAAYGLILPKEILGVCPCINIHASLLPRWRGAAPIQRAILAGDAESGITIMQMNEGLDTGDMLIGDRVAITHSTTAGQLHDALSEMGGELIIRYLRDMDKTKSIKQSDDSATYAKKISKDEAEVKWSDSATKIDLQIRAFNPFPGAYFVYNNEKVKILSAESHKCGHGLHCGEVVDDKLGIACFDGVIHPCLVQRPGKKVMSVSDMLRGYKIPIGTRIS